MGIEFPKGFEEKLKKQDLGKKAKEAVARARVAKQNREAFIDGFIERAGIRPADDLERRLYRVLLSTPLDTGTTMDSLFHMLGWDAPTGEIKDALQKNSEMRILAQTPFHLNTMVRAYWGKDDIDLETLGLGIVSKDQRHDEIMHDFVARQFQRAQEGAGNV